MTPHAPGFIALVVALVGASSLAADGGLRAPDGGVPPRGLACLSTWYAGTPTFRADGGWGLELEGGRWIPWARQASGLPTSGPHAPSELRVLADGGVLGEGDAEGEEGEESEEVAALQDLYRPPYLSGPIRPVDASDAGPIEDPGRVRVEELLRATYGSTKDEVRGHLTKVRFFGWRFPFHERAAPALSRVVERLAPQARARPKLRAFLTDIGGTWSWRRIARSENLSTHAWGIAIDLNVERSHYWRWTPRGQPVVWRNAVPQEIVDAFEAEGFIWGGRWQHFDTMHFEYRPELLAETCREGPLETSPGP